MKTEILIISHAKDSQWLEYCLRSIRKFATGFEKTSVVVPESDHMVFAEMCSKYGAHCRLFPQAPPPLGHLHHNIMKCYADEHCPRADFIFHIDSDCLFREPVTPEDFLHDGKPVLLIEEYASLEKQFPGFPWRVPVQNALKETVIYETMRRQGMINPKGIYADVRERIEKAHDTTFEEYVFAQKSDYPCGFAEFNTIGAVALTEPWNDKYHFIDAVKEGWPRSKIIQMWGHGGLDVPQNIWIDGVLTNIIPRDLIKKTLGEDYAD